MPENKTAIYEKLNELIALLAISEISDDTANTLRERFDKALNKSAAQPENDFSIQLLVNNKAAKRAIRGRLISRIVLILISIVMITMGLAMIIMPAPSVFEMYTIFYFTKDDGITLMDLISLLVILAGVFFLIRGIYRPAKK
ncbi:hypothetical protein [Mucilaginibacter sp.]